MITAKDQHLVVKGGEKLKVKKKEKEKLKEIKRISLGGKLIRT